MNITSHSPSETHKTAMDFAKKTSSGAVVGLCGTLGAGKTVFVQGMAEGLGIDPNAYVTSPTFALIHEYVGKGDHKDRPYLFHFDLYRLNSFEELMEIGFEDYSAREGIVVLEWADRFEELASFLTHRVEIELVAEETRQIKISSHVIS